MIKVEPEFLSELHSALFEIIIESTKTGYVRKVFTIRIDGISVTCELKEVSSRASQSNLILVMEPHSGN